jgi:hypothetical protein
MTGIRCYAGDLKNMEAAKMIRPLVLAAALFATSAAAQPYISVGGGASEDEGVATFNVGYQFFKNFAVEGGAVVVGSDIFGGRLLAVGAYPATDRLSLFGRAGVYHLTEDSGASSTAAGTTTSNPQRDRSTSIGYGIGAEYQVKAPLGVRVSLDRIESDDLRSGAITTIGAELVVRF